MAEVQEKKILKKLTPDQRAKYMGGFQPNIPSIDEISGVVADSEQTDGKETSEGNQPKPEEKGEKEVRYHNLNQTIYFSHNWR